MPRYIQNVEDPAPAGTGGGGAGTTDPYAIDSALNPGVGSLGTDVTTINSALTSKAPIVQPTVEQSLVVADSSGAAMLTVDQADGNVDVANDLVVGGDIQLTGTLTGLAVSAADVTGLAPSATTDTTNAANITTGRLDEAQLPETIPASMVTGLPDMSAVATNAENITANAGNIATNAGNIATIPDTTAATVDLGQVGGTTTVKGDLHVDGNISVAGTGLGEGGGGADLGAAALNLSQAGGTTTVLGELQVNEAATLTAGASVTGAVDATGAVSAGEFGFTGPWGVGDEHRLTGINDAKFLAFRFDGGPGTRLQDNVSIELNCNGTDVLLAEPTGVTITGELDATGSVVLGTSLADTIQVYGTFDASNINEGTLSEARLPTISGVASNATDIATNAANIQSNTTALGDKQDSLTFDAVPTDGSNNPVESNGVFDALADKQDTLGAGDVTNVMLAGSIDQSKITNLTTDLAAKQANINVSAGHALTMGSTAGDITSREIVTTTSDGGTGLITAGGVYTAIDTAIGDLVNGAPVALDTLNELAVKLEDEESELNALILTVDGKQDKLDGSNQITDAMIGDNTIAQSKIIDLGTALAAKADDTDLTGDAVVLGSGTLTSTVTCGATLILDGQNISAKSGSLAEAKGIFTTTTGTVEIGGGDVDLSVSGSTTTVKGALEATGALTVNDGATVNNNLIVGGADAAADTKIFGGGTSGGNSTDCYIFTNTSGTVAVGGGSGTVAVTHDLTVGGSLTVNGQAITGGGADLTAADLQLGQAGGTTTVNGDLQIGGGDINSTGSHFNMQPSVTSSGATISLTEEMEGASGIFGAGIRYNAQSDCGELVAYNGNTTNPDTPDTVVLNWNREGTAVQVGQTDGTGTVSVGGTVDLGAASTTTTVKGDLQVDGDVTVSGTVNAGTKVVTDTVDASTTNGNVSLFTNITTGGGNILIGATDTTTNMNGKLRVKGTIDVDGGAIGNPADTAATANVFESTTGTVVVGGGPVNISASGSTTTVKGPLQVDGSASFDGDIVCTAGTESTARHVFETAGDVTVGSASGILRAGYAILGESLYTDNGDTTLGLSGNGTSGLEPGGNTGSDRTVFSATTGKVTVGGGPVDLGAYGTTTTVKGDLTVGTADTFTTPAVIENSAALLTTLYVTQAECEAACSANPDVIGMFRRQPIDDDGNDDGQGAGYYPLVSGSGTTGGPGVPNYSVAEVWSITRGTATATVNGDLSLTGKLDVGTAAEITNADSSLCLNAGHEKAQFNVIDLIVPQPPQGTTVEDDLGMMNLNEIQLWRRNTGGTTTNVASNTTANTPTLVQGEIDLYYGAVNTQLAALNNGVFAVDSGFQMTTVPVDDTTPGAQSTVTYNANTYDLPIAPPIVRIQLNTPMSVSDIYSIVFWNRTGTTTESTSRLGNNTIRLSFLDTDQAQLTTVAEYTVPALESYTNPNQVRVDFVPPSQFSQYITTDLSEGATKIINDPNTVAFPNYASGLGAESTLVLGSDSTATFNGTVAAKGDLQVDGDVTFANTVTINAEVYAPTAVVKTTKLDAFTPTAGIQDLWLHPDNDSFPSITIPAAQVQAGDVIEVYGSLAEDLTDGQYGKIGSRFQYSIIAPGATGTTLNSTQWSMCSGGDNYEEGTFGYFISRSTALTAAQAAGDVFVGLRYEAPTTDPRSIVATTLGATSSLQVRVIRQVTVPISL